MELSTEILLDRLLNESEFVDALESVENHPDKEKIWYDFSHNFPHHYLENDIIVAAIKDFERLSITEQELISISPKITFLKKLKELSLSNNNLSTLPKSLSELVTLEKIELKNNLFEEIPDVLFELKYLKRLNIGDKIKEISPKIGQLKSLESLTIGHVGIELVPKEIQELKELWFLCIDKTNYQYNKENKVLIHNLEEWFNILGELPKLEFLSLTGCALSQIPKNIKYLKNLNILHLYGNEISHIPDEVFELSNLKELDLGNTWYTPMIEIDRIRRLAKERNIYLKFED